MRGQVLAGEGRAAEAPAGDGDPSPDPDAYCATPCRVAPARPLATSTIVIAPGGRRPWAPAPAGQAACTRACTSLRVPGVMLGSSMPATSPLPAGTVFG